MADEPRPPFVRFEVRPIEDRDASMEAGHYVGKDIIFAIVTPTGTRDTIEKPVEDWLASLEEGVRQERIPDSWLHAYRRAYNDYKEGRETPENGSPIKEWSVASPAQIKTMLDIGVRTVEQLAEANEETLGRIGMGARALQQKAVEWLKTSVDVGKASEKITALEVAGKEKDERIVELEKQVKDLAAQVKTLEKLSKQEA